MADLHTDIWSINDLVLHSSSKEDARDRFKNMQGFSLSRHAANLAFNDAMKERFKPKAETQASWKEVSMSFLSKVYAKTATKNTYRGINIQWPISQLIVNKQKTVETRTYPIPSKYIGKKLAIIETPGTKGNFKSRIIGFITFGTSFTYKDKIDFYKDVPKHHVTLESEWRWETKPKFGWPILKVEKLNSPLDLKGDDARARILIPGIIYQTVEVYK